MKKGCLILASGVLGAAIALAVVPANVKAALPCSPDSIRWAHSTNRVYIKGDVECTLTEIKELGSKYIPLTLVDPAQKIWFLGANLLLREGAKLVLHGSSAGGDVDELRLKSNNEGSGSDFVFIQADWGTVDIANTKITSWNENAGGPDIEYAQYKRAYLRVRSRLGKDGATLQESRMDIRNSDIGYLGYHGSETYGLSWKVLGSTASDKTIFDVVGVYGDVVNSRIHHNYFGVYTYGVQGMNFIDNEVYENVAYGIDPHDDSDDLRIEGNYAHHNGAHGIICSQRCNNLVISSNTSSFNNGNGIMLHRSTNDSLVENNIANNNADSGVAIFDSHGNIIRNNEAKYNSKGIRLSVGSSNNVVENNNFSENSKYGMYFYKGSDTPASGDGRITLNTFQNNTINANATVGAKVQEADFNIFEGNTLTGNGSYPFEIRNSYNNAFEKNIFAGNARNYYYAKYSAINGIQDSDAFAVKIGDTLSAMTIADSNNTIYQNSKEIPTTVSPLQSAIVLDRSNAGSSVVTFNQLRFSARPEAESLVVEPLMWNTDGSFFKKWTAKNESSSVLTVKFVVGDLVADASHDVLVNGTLWKTFVADGSGRIFFDYTGVFESTKTFEVKPALKTLSYSIGSTASVD